MTRHRCVAASLQRCGAAALRRCRLFGRSEDRRNKISQSNCMLEISYDGQMSVRITPASRSPTPATVLPETIPSGRPETTPKDEDGPLAKNNASLLRTSPYVQNHRDPFGENGKLTTWSAKGGTWRNEPRLQVETHWPHRRCGWGPPSVGLPMVHTYMDFGLRTT